MLRLSEKLRTCFSTCMECADNPQLRVPWIYFRDICPRTKCHKSTFLPEEFVKVLPAADRPRKDPVVSCESGRHNVAFSFSARVSFSIMDHAKARKIKTHTQGIKNRYLLCVCNKTVGEKGSFIVSFIFGLNIISGLIFYLSITGTHLLPSFGQNFSPAAKFVMDFAGDKLLCPSNKTLEMFENCHSVLLISLLPSQKVFIALLGAPKYKMPGYQMGAKVNV